jgi:hypothetical protein
MKSLVIENEASLNELVRMDSLLILQSEMPVSSLSFYLARSQLLFKNDVYLDLELYSDFIYPYVENNNSWAVFSKTNKFLDLYGILRNTDNKIYLLSNSRINSNLLDILPNVIKIYPKEEVKEVSMGMNLINRIAASRECSHPRCKRLLKETENIEIKPIEDWLREKFNKELEIIKKSEKINLFSLTNLFDVIYHTVKTSESNKAESINIEKNLDKLNPKGLNVLICDSVNTHKARRFALNKTNPLILEFDTDPIMTPIYVSVFVELLIKEL